MINRSRHYIVCALFFGVLAVTNLSAMERKNTKAVALGFLLSSLTHEVLTTIGDNTNNTTTLEHFLTEHGSDSANLAICTTMVGCCLGCLGLGCLMRICMKHRNKKTTPACKPEKQKSKTSSESDWRYDLYDEEYLSDDLSDDEWV